VKVLVTGTGGFVGPHLARLLVARGHVVIGLDRRAGTVTEGVRQVAADLGDAEALAGVAEELRPDAVVHLAGWSHVGRSWDSPAATYSANVVGTLNLYSALYRVLGTNCRFLHVSSADVYGGSGIVPANETTPARPNSPYAASKLASEEALRLLAAAGRGPRLIIARPFNHIGPGQAPGFVVPSFATQVAEIESGRRTVLRHGNLDARRDFSDVRDIVMAYALLLEQFPAQPLFVVASGRSISIRSLVEGLFARAGIAPRMEVDPALLRPIDTPEMRGDATLLHQLTGWSPAYSIESTLDEILHEARQRIAAAEANVS
jgi:GDP-4-dehydro-6-deoxy-D-mannose reductase